LFSNSVCNKKREKTSNNPSHSNLPKPQGDQYKTSGDGVDRAAFVCWDQIQRNTVLPDLPNYGLGCQGGKEKVFALLMVKSQEEEGEKQGITS